jgi:translation initiation factor IF-2
MAVTTVAQFAAQLNRPIAALLEQLQSAGVAKQSPDDALTDGDKERLLEYLRSAHGTASAERKKIVLTRKSTSEIKQADATGKARTIQVEVRKKRTFVKRDEFPGAEEAAAPAASPNVIDAEEQARRDAEAAAQAALIQRQLEDAAQRQAEEQARREREAAEAAAAEAALAAEREAAARAAAEAEEAARAAAAAEAAAQAAAQLSAAAEVAPTAAAPVSTPTPTPPRTPTRFKICNAPCALPQISTSPWHSASSRCS